MKKQVIIAALICASLGMFYFFSRERSVRVGIRELHLPVVDAKRVTKIIYAGKENFALVKDGESFALEIPDGAQTRTVPASKEAIAELFEAVLGIKSGVFVTEQPAKFAQFKVDEALGQKVTVQGTEPVWDLIIGDYAEEEGRYVRVPSQEAVFLSKARFWDITRNNISDFRERQIVGRVAESIRAVHATKGNSEKIGLLRDNNKQWMLDSSALENKQGMKMSSQRATEYVSTVASLRAASFVESAAELESAQALLKRSSENIVLESYDNEVMEIITARDKKSMKIYAQLKDSELVFEISEYVYDRLYPTYDNFQDIAEHAQAN